MLNGKFDTVFPAASQQRMFDCWARRLTERNASCWKAVTSSCRASRCSSCRSTGSTNTRADAAQGHRGREVATSVPPPASPGLDPPTLVPIVRGSAIDGHGWSAGDTRNRMQIIELEMVARTESNHRHADFQYSGEPGSARLSRRNASDFRPATEPPSRPSPCRTLPGRPTEPPARRPCGHGVSPIATERDRTERHPVGPPQPDKLLPRHRDLARPALLLQRLAPLVDHDVSFHQSGAVAERRTPDDGSIDRYFSRPFRQDTRRCARATVSPCVSLTSTTASCPSSQVSNAVIVASVRADERSRSETR